MDGYFLRPDRIDRHVRIDVGGFQLHQSTSLRGRRKRGAFNNAIGRSRGGQTTKIHALTDDIGRPLAFLITPGNTHDLVGARGLIGMVRAPRRLLADRAYDARSLRDELAARRIKAVIPPNPTGVRTDWDRCQRNWRSRSASALCQVRRSSIAPSPWQIALVKVHRRQKDGTWTEETFEEFDIAIPLPPLATSVTLNEIYDILEVKPRPRLRVVRPHPPLNAPSGIVVPTFFGRSPPASEN